MGGAFLRLIALAAMLSAACLARAEPKGGAPSLWAEGAAFVLALGDGRLLRSPDLVGAIFDAETPSGAPVRLRIETVVSGPGAPRVLLHDLRFEAAPGDWRSLCGPDGAGRRLAFPVEGAWSAEGRFIADPDRFFVTCTGGAEGKCVMLGYDPWAEGPNGQRLPALYEACRHMMRASYCDGLGTTAEGSEIDVYDDLGIQRPKTLDDPRFAFEAGWTPRGAACVAHPRRPQRMSASALGAVCPALAQVEPCNEATARGAGAMLFNRSRPDPRF